MNFNYPECEQIPQLLQLWKEVFGEYDGFWELFLKTVFLPDHCRCITQQGQVLAGLYWFDCSCGNDQIAYIYAVVTAPAHRGKGLCRMLLEDVHQLLMDRGYASAMLVPADPGLRNMYQKMGYQNCTGISEISCFAAETTVEMQNICPEEFARLRRKLLPEKGVLQEGMHLSFLAAQAQLFAGTDFLLAAWREEDTLHGMELLGNTAAAPKILQTLGCRKGIFQIPGTEKPYAMFRKLRNDAITPSYFGFSYD